ncbi:NAD(+) diphosphatase [Aestuariivirga litoralis]|uniref:NAD(+) diphosphatase n=1 Tax=Aestuariivirga litoralis TaxID=2650924 RepID=UPI0018C5F236|nr:NAD(+) diphosphatase [Aestuariivirga litoralis]
MLTKLNAPAAKFLQIHGDGVLMNGESLVVARPEPAADYVYLGDDEKHAPWFAYSRPSNEPLTALRPLMLSNMLSREELSIVAQARSLVHWHERHGFCANCGHATQMSDAGYRRHCPSCKTDHFPRTDPVVIMAVRHGDNILLGRQKAWAPGMYSCVAGFMEPGETLEQAVAREVFEETGVVVGKVTYVASQPWPFPSSLMIGCIAETDQAEIIVDEKELENARWFSRAEVGLMLEQKHPEKLTASMPHAIAHHVMSIALQ